QIRLDFLRLRTNFRSTEGIVEWVNNTFSPVFPSAEDSFTGSISYAPSVAVKEGEKEAVSVRLYGAPCDALEAQEAVSIIKSIPPDETAAVLCRTRAHAGAVVEALKREGISFRAQEMDPMAGRAVIQDLMTILRALAHPYDRVAWLASLRAPWCGLNLSDLHALTACDRDTPVWRLMNDEARLANLSEDGRKRLWRTARRFEAALGLWGRVGVRSVVESLWIELGGPICVEDAPSMKDAEAFFALLEPLGCCAGQADIRGLRERTEKLYADHGGSAETRVDVMTVHRAKGLEFDHVIIPGLGKKARGDRKKLLLWMERGDGLLLAPIARRSGKAESPVYDYLSAINKKKAEYERARLFYVAATRARKRLHLFGHIKEEADASSGSFLSVIGHALGAEAVVDPPAPEALADGDVAPKIQRPVKRLPLSWALPQPALAVGLPEKKERGAEEAEFYWAGEVRRHIGTVVHRYLCRIAKEGPEKWDGPRVKGETGRMEARLRTLGLSAGAARDAAAEGVQIVCRALTDERGRWALSAHEEGSTEAPLTGVVNGEIVHAVIDRTFVEGGVRWVVDYKSGTHEGGSLEAFLESERQRYAPQLARYAALLLAGGEKREIRKGLYYPALGAWVEL
ncbi:MAG: 3'-5' exonuclease, partial [Deltaproteobacteria bacterium]|nr:3'-5' exonuclease [Deltaproteobacteria bacterium]